MVTKIHRDALGSEISSIRQLLEHSAGRDPLGERSLRKRLEKLESERASLERRDSLASVALVFDGEPVRGSSAIEADFAGRALQDYQDLISKQMASSIGHTAERGRLPQQVYADSKMTITGIVHGSFGFLLEEDGANQTEMFDSPAKVAVESITNLLDNVSSIDGRGFEDALETLDVRVFQTLKKFVTTLRRSRAVLKLSEDVREMRLDSYAVERAYERVTQSNVEENDEAIDGELLGLVPVQRRFDFRRSDNGEVLQGKVSVNLSEDYLERIEREGMIAAGGQWKAVIRTKEVHHADGRHTSVSRMLVDLVRL